MNSTAPPKSVILDTTTGLIGIELYWDHCPRTCQNFYDLVILLFIISRQKEATMTVQFSTESLQTL